MLRTIGCLLRAVCRAGLAIALLVALANPVPARPVRPLILRHPWADGHAALVRLASDYARQGGTPVKVIYDPTPPSASRPLPAGTDIAGLRRFGANEPAIAALARAGRIQDLTPWMDIRWRSGFVPAMLAPFAIHPGNQWGAPRGIYGVPLTTYAQFFLYRPDIFARAHVAGNPTRWQWNQFLAAGRSLRAIKVEPLVGAFHQRSHPALAQMYEQAQLGTSGLLATYRGQIPYRSPGWRALFHQYSDLRQAGICTSNLAFAPRLEAETAFLRGRAGMLVDGPWFARVQTQSAPLVSWRLFFPPSGGWGARFLPAAPGGVGDGLVINRNSARRRQAAAFLRWLTLQTYPQVTYANATWMMPASWGAAKSRALNPRLQAFAAYIGYVATDLTVFQDPVVSRVLYDGVIAILRGRSNPETVLVQADQMRAQRRR